jgi:hypothetical protein
VHLDLSPDKTKFERQTEQLLASKQVKQLEIAHRQRPEDERI